MKPPLAKILILGDSHVSVFCPSDWRRPRPVFRHLDIHICKRQSATAYGLLNEASESQALDVFRRFLGDEEVPDLTNPSRRYHAKLRHAPADFIAFFIGEVDARSVFAKKQAAGLEASQIAARCTSRLHEFIQRYVSPLVPPRRILLLGPHLSKTAAYGRSLDEITESTILYCRALEELARRSGYLYADINDHLRDPATGLLAQRFYHPDYAHDRWHINPFSEVAPLWNERLMATLEGSVWWRSLPGRPSSVRWWRDGRGGRPALLKSRE